MALRVNFSKELFRQKLEEFSDEIEEKLIIKLNIIGLKCVKMSRESVGINPSAFPVSDMLSRSTAHRLRYQPWSHLDASMPSFSPDRPETIRGL